MKLPLRLIGALLGAVLIALLATGQAPAVAHFHHLHLNVTDPAAAIDFYTRTFDCEKATFAGVEDAVWAQKSWLLFNKVSGPPPWELVSAIWHFGWGAEDMQAAYKQQLDRGTKFFTPITPLGANFWYAYVEGPDRALIELNTANHHHFGHLHLLSEDPVTTGEWYMKWFGAARQIPGIRGIALVGSIVTERPDPTTSTFWSSLPMMLISRRWLRARGGFKVARRA